MTADARRSSPAREGENPDIALKPIPHADLIALASGAKPPTVGMALPGALPPDYVAARALRHLAAGKPASWCSTFYIENAEGAVVGSCGFKDAPVDREVEIGYEVAPAVRGAGVGAAAVRCLLVLAADAPEVDRVIANVAPGNAASTRLVQRLGFVATHEWVDASGERLIRWCWSTRCTRASGCPSA